MAKAKQKQKTKRAKYSYSGYQMASKKEVEFAQKLDAFNLVWIYEPEKIDWILYKKRKYTPDFKVMRKDNTFFYVEYKGYLRKDDKDKMIAIKQQHPNLDIRFVFQNANKPTSSYVRKDGTRMSHAEWAEKYGYLWSEGFIPESWYNGIGGAKIKKIKEGK